MNKDYYLVLMVEQDATESEIKSSFRRLARVWHPDRHQNAGEARRNTAEEMFKKLGEAYRVLSDERRRADYDLTLQRHEPDFHVYYAEKSSVEKKNAASHAENETLRKAIIDMLAVEKRSSDLVIGRFNEISKKVFRGEYDEAKYLSDIKPAKSDAASCADRIQLIVSKSLQKQVRFIANDIRAACSLEARLRDFARKAPRNLQEAIKIIDDCKEGLIPTLDWLAAIFGSKEFWGTENAALRAKLYQRINMKRGVYTHILLRNFVKNEQDAQCTKVFKKRVFRHQHLFSLSDMEDFYRKIKVWGKGKSAILDDNLITWEEIRKNRGEPPEELYHVPICELVMSVAKASEKREKNNLWFRERAKDYGTLSELSRPFLDFDFLDVDAGGNWAEWKRAREQAKAKAEQERYRNEIRNSGAALERGMRKLIDSFDAALERYDDVFVKTFQGEFDKKAYSATVYLNEQSDAGRKLSDVCREFGALVDIAKETFPELVENAVIMKDELEVETASVNETTSASSYVTAKKYGEYALKVRELLDTFKQTDVSYREAMERTYALAIALLNELNLDIYLPLRNKIYKNIPFAVDMYGSQTERVMDFLRQHEEFRVVGITLKKRLVSEAPMTFSLADAYLALKMGARFSRHDVESVRWKLRDVDGYNELWCFEQAALKRRKV